MINDPDYTAARLLIVDDEPANVALLQYILGHAGYRHVRATTDPREAMKLFEEHAPDLILLDLMMPHVSGLEVMASLARRVSRADCLPILVLTADVTPDTKYQALQAGASDFLTKPFDHVEVLLRIRHLLQIRHQHQQLAGQKDALEEAVIERTVELRLANSQLEETLVKLRETQQQVIQHERMSALGSMAAGLAHDFNNSLSLILGYSELLQNDLTGTPYQQNSDEFLGTIITSAQDAAKMFNRLRTFYRAQEEEDKHTGLALNGLVEQAVSLTRPRWHGQALGAGVTITLALELAADLPPLVADAAELRELLTNLIFNAVDAMPAGGTLTLRTRHEPDTVVLEVSDTGVGMDEETSRRCLEPFFTTKGAQGTGLGLAMVYGTVQRHGGVIDLQSRVGEGTTFSLRLPLRSADEAATLDETVFAEQPPRRVLVVDDQPVFTGILRHYLTQDGHHVQTAGDGREALAKFRDAAPPFDLVITDGAMPGMGGEQLAAELKGLAPAVRVILLSGFGGLDAAPHARHPAVDLALVKPITHAALRAAINRALAPRPEPETPAAPVPPARRIPITQAIQSRLRLTRRAA